MEVTGSRIDISIKHIEIGFRFLFNMVEFRFQPTCSLGWNLELTQKYLPPMSNIDKVLVHLAVYQLYRSLMGLDNITAKSVWNWESYSRNPGIPHHQVIYSWQLIMLKHLSTVLFCRWRHMPFYPSLEPQLLVEPVCTICFWLLAFGQMQGTWWRLPEWQHSWFP